MTPKFSAATNLATEPPELSRPLPEAIKTLSPPYSIPYAKTTAEGKLPEVCISEWTPSPGELEILKNGGSVYLMIFASEHPQSRVWAGPEGFPTKPPGS